ncbi:hypothetical protein A6E13_03125 [Aliivibrio fischeri]|uniref:hypothetical protein n=1 Tax=Aliivibrio fischeri TaxID=668 RepID=UPI00080DA109|nr:hypothetical protein [Aliivibrio fischeri]OCH30207.1 hypothetical protein A6E13_03125 [Aliivibrio fischeri]
MLGIYSEKLAIALQEKGILEDKIAEVIDSGYAFCPSLGANVVIDQMYGLKGSSSCFELDDFVAYLKGDRTPFVERLPFAHILESHSSLPLLDLSHCTYVVKNMDDIQKILSDDRRKHYISRGALSFRGQTQEYTFKRKVPNPLRADADGKEISIFPGVFRQNPNSFYSFLTPFEEKRTTEFLLHELEPNDPDIYIYAPYSYDSMRVEQHYASQTSGLDISFDIETAIFFATYQFRVDENNVARHTKIKKGQHKGVIYGFKFTHPAVNKSQYYIDKFDLFKTNKPERILRQDCGLPLISSYERNIAMTDIDFVMYLHEDFDYDGVKTPKYMFPDENEDKFYGKLIELKKKHPDLLSNVVEYVN